MNNPEVTMHGKQQPTRFDALEKATTAAGIAISLVIRVPAPVKSIADQVIRSSSSVPANLAEGAGRSGRDRFHHWRIAYGSAKEVDIHLRLLIEAGAIDSQRAESSLRLFDDVRAMTWRLLHPLPSRR
jgi:four helix bundle protein